jgi:hypothetical protein
MLKDIPIRELKSFCKERKLKGYSNLNHTDLVELMEENYTEEELSCLKGNAKVEVKAEEVKVEKKVTSELEVVIPYEHTYVTYIGNSDYGITPTINKHQYKKGTKVLVTKDEANRIISRFGDQFKEVK